MVARLRELLVRTSPGDVGAPDTEPTREFEVPAESDAVPEGMSVTPGPADVGRLRRERRRLLKARERNVRDLGGLTLEMFRRDRLKPTLLQRRASDLLSIEATVYEVDEALSTAEMAAAAPTIGSIERCSCGEDILEGARFCPSCGLAIEGEEHARTCTQCTASLPAGAQYCGICGVPAADGAPETRTGW
jgi:hypothetical protein